MINKKLLCELNEIIEKINKENISFKELNGFVEDADFFVKILQSVNKTSLKKMMSAEKSLSKISKVDDTYLYTKGEVYEIISSRSFQEIQKEFNAKQIKAMFTAVYGVKPMSSQKKGDILQDIINWFSNYKRAKALSEL